MIWHDRYDRKIMMCLWLIAHRALPIGTWGKGPIVDPRCIACGQIESISHCLWECREAGSVFMMMWRNLIAHAKQFTKGRIELFD